MIKIESNFFKNKSAPLLFSLGIFGFPLVASIPVFFEIESRPISFSLRIIVILLAIQALFSTKKKMVANRNLMLFSLFWVLYSLRVFYTYFAQDQIVHFMSDIEFFAFTFGTCFIPALAFFKTPQIKQGDDKSFFNITFYVVLIATSSNLYLSLTKNYNLENLSGRLNTEVLNPITFGGIGASLTILSIYFFFSKSSGKPLDFFVFIVGVAVGLLATLSSGSKSPMISLIVVLFIFFIFQFKPKKTIATLILILTLIGLSFFALDFLQEKFNINAFKRFDGLFNFLDGKEADLSTNIRVHLYNDSWNQFLNNPFLGSGIVEKNTGFYPHNIFIESFMSTGFIGGLIFVILSISMALKSVYLLKTQHNLRWVALLAIYFLISNLFSGSIFGSSTLWLSMAFIFNIKKAGRAIARSA